MECMWFYLLFLWIFAIKLCFLIADKMSEGSSSNCLFTFKKRSRGGGAGRGGGGGMRKRKDDSSASSSSEDETTVVR